MPHAEVLEQDGELTDMVSAGIEALNSKYNRPGNDIFFLFHRSRVWNAKEKTWMGYERKRGKLAALNTLLRGGRDHGFSLIRGNYPIAV